MKEETNKVSEPCWYVRALAQLCKPRKCFNMSIHKQQSIITRSLQSWLAGSEHSHMCCLLMCDFCLSLHQVLMAVCLALETDCMSPLSSLLSMFRNRVCEDGWVAACQVCACSGLSVCTTSSCCWTSKKWETVEDSTIVKKSIHTLSHTVLLKYSYFFNHCTSVWADMFKWYVC